MGHNTKALCILVLNQHTGQLWKNNRSPFIRFLKTGVEGVLNQMISKRQMEEMK